MKGRLEARDVTMQFGALVAVDGVTLDIEPGSMTGIIGPNGAGKTTLLSVLAGELTPTGGSVRFAGRDLARMPMHKVCRLGICRTYQIPRPFPEMTVAENVEIASIFGAHGHGDIKAALEVCGLSGLALRRANTLRPSELRRLELAKALATSPEVLLVDEIAAGMPSDELPGLVDQLARINATGVTLLVVEHVMELLLKLVPRLIALDHGRVIVEGATKKVLEDERVLAAYFGGEVRHGG